MHIHYLQHVSFEGLGIIEDFILDHRVTTTKLYNDEQLPELIDFDCLIVMGGPMGIYDVELYPWLTKERVLN